MRKTFIIGAVLCAFGLMTACNNQTADDGADKATQENEIIYNDKIQNTFFGVPFGASKEGVVSAFEKQDFYEDRYSTDERLSFKKRRVDLGA